MISRNKNQRIGIFIDIQNLYHSAKNLYKSRVNFRDLLKVATANRELVRAIAYVVKSDTDEEKAFFEYHMYTLQRKATVKDNQTKQISLLSANNVPVKKLFIYDPVDYYGWSWYYYESPGSAKEQKIKVKLELSNTKQNNL